MTWINAYAARICAIGLALFHTYTGFAGTFYPLIQRSVPVTLALILTFITVRATKNQSDKTNVPIYDWLLVVITVPVFGYIAYYSDYLSERWPMSLSYPMSTVETVFAILAVVLILEATRRVLGWLLVIVVLASLLYTYLGEYLPIGGLSHRPFSLGQILDYMYLTDNGVWGVALGVTATYIVLFIIFGAFAEKAGVAEFFIDLANSIAGHTKGVPAKVAIFSSAMIGSVTGSTVANVYTTGQFTIPMMKRLGYKPSVAGAVEALASNGGQIMPPILGAAAFILAAYSDVPYLKIVAASVIPAILYFGGLFWYIHLEAHKTGLVGIPRSEKPEFLAVLLKGGHLFLPLIALISCLVYGFSPVKAAFYGIIFTVAISWLRKETRLGPKEILEAFEAGGRNSIMILVTCAAVGFVIGGFLLTGLGLNLSSAIISISSNSLLATMFLVGVACIILGMGMSTVAAFILVSVVGTPALTAHGVDVVVANMFVFYFALLSHITPPVCLAIFAAAQIAGSNIWETAFVGIKMSLVPYLLPFLIVLMPSLLLFGTYDIIIIDTVAAAVGLTFMISGIQGWALQRLNLVKRALYLIAGSLLVWPDLNIKSVGALLSVAIIVFGLVSRKRLTENGKGRDST